MPIDPSSILVANSLLVNELLIPLKNMVPYQHHCPIKLVCESESDTIIFDAKEVLSVKTCDGKLATRV